MANLDFSYRICAYNAEDHGGVHVHDPRREIRPVRIPTPAAAERIAHRYAEEIQVGFEWNRFQEVVKRWRSESRRP